MHGPSPSPQILGGPSPNPPLGLRPWLTGTSITLRGHRKEERQLIFTNRVGYWGSAPGPDVRRLRRSPISYSRKGHLVISNRSFALSALAFSQTHMFVCEKLKMFPSPESTTSAPTVPPFFFKSK